MSDCIFCQIVEGRIPSTKIFEDENFIAFMDINPISEGHLLLVSKKHYEILTEVPDDLLAAALPLAKKLATAVLKGVGAEGFNLLQNNGVVAGQMVGHWHLHIIPRKNKDEFPQKLGQAADLTKLPFVAEAIRDQL